MKRHITLTNAIALAVSLVVGTGIVSLMGLALEVGGPHGSIFGWLVAALVITPFLVIFSHLSGRSQNKNGLSDCAAEALGEKVGRGFHLLLLVLIFILLPVIALIGATYLQEALGLTETWRSFLAIALLFAATLINLLGACKASLLNKLSVTILLLMLLSLILYYHNYAVLGIQALIYPEENSVPIDLSHVWKVAALVIFAFLGWENVMLAAPEMKNPQRTIPLTFAGSFVIVALLYLLLALIMLGASIAGLKTTGLAGMAILFKGMPGGFILSASIGFISLANASSWMYGLSRTIQTSSQKGELPVALSEVSRTGVPCFALLTIYFICSLMLFACYSAKCSISNLFLIVVQFELVIYGISILTFVKLFKGWKVWVTSAFASIAMIFLVSGFSLAMIAPISVVLLGAFQPWRKGERATKLTRHVKECSS